jgi:hypothetical protein
MMPLTTTLPNQNVHFITLQTAIDMTTLYRSRRESILKTSEQGLDILPLSETFSRGCIDVLLANENCEGIRIYYSMDENEKVHAIIVGINALNEDILPSNTSIEENPVIVENGQRCPPSCPPSSALNE